MSINYTATIFINYTTTRLINLFLSYGREYCRPF